MQLALLLLAGWLALGPSVRAADAPGAPPEHPDLPTLLERLVDRAQHSQAQRETFRARHAYAQTRVRTERSPNGKLRSRTEEQLLNAPEEASDASDAHRGQRAYRERDFEINHDLLSRFDFEHVSCETINGHRACRLDFRPRAGNLPVRRTSDRFVNRIGGTLWIRTSDGALVRAKLRLLEQVSFVGGIAGACHTMECLIDRAATDDGLWYTRSAQWNVDYREFLTRRVVDYTETTQLQPATPQTHPAAD